VEPVLSHLEVVNFMRKKAGDEISRLFSQQILSRQEVGCGANDNFFMANAHANCSVLTKLIVAWWRYSFARSKPIKFRMELKGKRNNA
jgi:hypothetical protein